MVESLVKISKVALIRVDKKPTTVFRHPRHIHPPSELKYIEGGAHLMGVESILLDGWVNLWTPGALAQKVPSSCDIAVIKGMSYCLEESMALARLLKNKGIITLAVGQFVSHAAQQTPLGWRDVFDISVLGEPEVQVIELFNQLNSQLETERQNEIIDNYNKNFVLQNEIYIENPMKLPALKITREELRNYPFPFPMRGKFVKLWGYVMTSWGCPYMTQCKFCSYTVRKSMGSTIRLRSTEQVVAEIKRLVSIGVDAICFEDDTLFSHKKNFLDICEKIITSKIKVSWMASVRLNELDEERIRAAALAGAKMLKVGIEAGSPRIIERIGKSRDGDLWIEQMKSMFELLKKYNIGTVGLYMIGNPGETLNDVMESLRLAKELEHDYLQVQVYTVYPDSTFYKELSSEEKRNYHYGTNNVYHHTNNKWSPSDISPSALLSLRFLFYRKYYLRFSFVAKHFKLCWRSYLHISTFKRLKATFFHYTG
ncbi:MAG: B12-binding domain-containing radical SAM protein [Halobacteriovoraceae bacterium]|jgi:anaerobic magnesium-protoporphyrin IX monomethyl ester cyclase|nr:B12-binding domain-containing radical SAM protein [Halobacteriovoraceae bacterium]